MGLNLFRRLSRKLRRDCRLEIGRSIKREGKISQLIRMMMMMMSSSSSSSYMFDDHFQIIIMLIVMEFSFYLVD